MQFAGKSKCPQLTPIVWLFLTKLENLVALKRYPKQCQLTKTQARGKQEPPTATKVDCLVLLGFRCFLNYSYGKNTESRCHWQTKGTFKGLAQWVHLRPNPVLATEKNFSPFHFISSHETPMPQITLQRICRPIMLFCGLQYLSFIFN